MSERKRFILPMKFMRWSTLQTSDGRPLRPDSEMKAIGYILVYENIQTLRDDHGHDAEFCIFEERDAK